MDLVVSLNTDAEWPNQIAPLKWVFMILLTPQTSYTKKAKDTCLMQLHPLRSATFFIFLAVITVCYLRLKDSAAPYQFCLLRLLGKKEGR
ncbi:hypothetical protein X474_21410 [Dethiosulfatarculus sandiegensis]|uniref:Uncharacterized protein n=1 Tax=Dethiosulfatarculus sandiegensis TaxID=1429043 RepID=A0A0D2J8G7_9BACT|nr:hypothetical protein X474_21410 [Dethiosulfatarculus sandiegensis]